MGFARSRWFDSGKSGGFAHHDRLMRADFCGARLHQLLAAGQIPTPQGER